MKKILFFLFLFPACTIAQKPFWTTDENRRESFPHNLYFTGFATNEGSNTAEFAAALRASAKSELIESIQVSVQSSKMYGKSEINGNFSENFLSNTLSFANADVNGMKTEYYYDNTTRTGYAFAYAGKNELRGYYKANIAFIIQKIESGLRNARQLESDGNKGKAKKIYEEINPLFNDLAFAQSLLITIGSDEESIQTEKSLALKSEITIAVSRMQSAIIVCIKSRERNFTQPVKLLEPKLKAALSQYGCSYATDPGKADWLLLIDASTYKGNEIEGLCFSYLNVAISLVEQRTGREIYGNKFTGLKGGGLDYETAGRKAYDASLHLICNEIIRNMEK
ncbi:MAG: hypothetical protein LBJ72_08460 [Dysgonamonadaceae bacterium]|jgi:hypothetical protein|nr:hypothetical protein [Dysgonamonadaceae bacterium]